MKSHQLAWILLKKPDVPVVIWKQSFYDVHERTQISSVAYSNCSHFKDSLGSWGDENDGGRECIEIE